MTNKYRTQPYRLNQYHRSALERLASDMIKEPELEAALKEAYRVLVIEAKKLVEEAFPSSDMKVLAKYDLTREDHCLLFAKENSADVESFTLDEPDIIIRPAKSCQNHIFLLNDRQWGLFTAYREAVEKLKETIRERLNLYRTLIRSSVYFSDILVAWPKAEEHEKAVFNRTPGLPSVLSEDFLAKIRQDQERL